MAGPWSLKKGNRIFTPITTEMILRWIAEGRVTARALVWRNGFAGWEPIEDVEDFRGALEKAGASDFI